LEKNLFNRNLTVLTEGGQIYGFGHLTRSISIAKQFQEYNFAVHFVVHGDDSISTTLKNYNFTLLNWHEAFKKSLPLITKNSFLLIDSITISDEQLLFLESLDLILIYIDDEKRRNILNRGFVIDWTIGLNETTHFIPKKKNVSYLLGSRYTPLREDFQKAKSNQLRKQIKQLMMTFGGSDVRNLTPKIIQYLNQNFPQYVQNVIIGNGFTNLNAIKESASSKTNLIYNADASTMIQIMQQSDVAIAAGGQTLYELAKIGIPTIGILLVDNAKDDTFGWEELGFLKYIGTYDDELLLENLQKNLFALQDYTIRKAMQLAGFKNIGGNGAKLLVKSILGDHYDCI
jgi:UDP-2,4-diacetamido-2,4,6-trideoxy-beta-L-altropyranose hydrolase